MKLQNADCRQDMEVLNLTVDKAMTKLTVELEGFDNLIGMGVVKIVEIPFQAVMEAVARGTGKL